MHAMQLRVCLVVLAAFAAGVRGQGDAAGVSASVTRDEMYLGEEIVYQVTVDGAASAERPEVTAPDGLDIRFMTVQRSESSSTSFAGGRRTVRSTVTMHFQYRIRAERPGTFVIPPATIEIDGLPHVTQSVPLRVVTPPESATARLVVELERDRIYVGETVPLRVVWRIQNQIERLSFDESRLPASFDVVPGRQADAAAGRQQIEFTFRDERVVGTVARRIIGGEEFVELTFELLLTPREPGAFELGPIRVIFNERTSSFRVRRTMSEAEPIGVDVAEPPADGRPAGYAGLIGQYGLSAQATPTDVNVGDPIELEVTVFGDEPMRGVQDGPDLDSVPGFGDRFRVDPDGWSRQPATGTGTRVFRTTVRAKSADVDAIPAIALPHFRPDAGAYEVAQSEPIPLSVRATREVTAADAIRSGPIGAPGERSALVPAGSGIWAPQRGAALLRADGFDPFRAAREPAWIAALAGMPSAYAVAALLAWRRRGRDPDAERVRRAYARACRELSRAGPGAAARRYVADVAGLVPEAVTSADVARLRVDGALAERLAAVIGADERGRFGAGRSETAASEVRRVLELAERQRRATA